MATKTLPHRQIEALDRPISSASSLEQAISLLKAEVPTMSDDFVCGWPFEQQRMQDEQTLEGMVDGMGLRAILLILQEIAYAKADQIQANWQDPNLAKEWKMAGNKLGQWAKTINNH
jgi:hypothetical protein